MTVSLFSCAHIDISCINTSEYYKGTINDSLYVVKFENLSNASAKEIDGVFYKVDTSIYADPVTFNSKLKGKKIILRTKDGEKENKLDFLYSSDNGRVLWTEIYNRRLRTLATNTKRQRSE